MLRMKALQIHEILLEDTLAHGDKNRESCCILYGGVQGRDQGSSQAPTCPSASPRPQPPGSQCSAEGSRQRDPPQPEAKEQREENTRWLDAGNCGGAAGLVKNRDMQNSKDRPVRAQGPETQGDGERLGWGGGRWGRGPSRGLCRNR